MATIQRIQELTTQIETLGPEGRMEFTKFADTGYEGRMS